MIEIFRFHIDYLMFLEGLAHLAMAVICFHVLQNDKRHRISWVWLGFFSVLHGISEWLGLMFITVEASRLFNYLQIALLVMALLCLIEFARLGTLGLWGRGPGRWIYLPVSGLVIWGALFESAWLNNVVLFLQLLGGLWAALIVLCIYKFSENKNPYFIPLGLSLGLYLFSRHMCAGGEFTNAHLYCQILNTTLAVGTLVTLWAYSVSFLRDGSSEEGGFQRKRIFIISWCASALILLAGFFLTDRLGRLAEHELRDNTISRVITAASAIGPERLEKLKGSVTDYGTSDYEFLRRQLITIKATNPQCRFVYLMGFREGKVVFLVDAEPEDSEDYSPPGQIYNEASFSLVESFATGRPFIEGPLKDRWGEWYSGLAPIHNENGDKVIAVIGMDISSGDWPVRIGAYRLAAIAITLIIFLLAVFFVAMRVNKDSALKSAASEKRFKAIFDNTAAGIFVYDIRSRRVLSVNPYVHRWLGYNYDEIYLRNIDEVFGGWLRDVEEEFVAGEAQDLFNVIEKEGQCLNKAGFYVEVGLTGTVFNYRDMECFLIIARDIGQRKIAEQKQQLAHRQLLDIIEFLPDATFVVGQDKKVIAWNKAMEEMTGIMKTDIIGNDSSKCSVAFYGWQKRLLIDLVFSGSRGSGRQYDYLRKKGNTLLAETFAPAAWQGKGAHLWIAAAPLYDSDGNMTGAIETIRDITERKRMEEQLKYLATHDPLTGILNRYSLEEALKRAVARAKRGNKSALLFIDLDNFKLVNDTYGHAAGDKLLINMVKILSRNLRDTDILARLGGDEFAVLLEGTSAGEAEIVAEKLRRSVVEEEMGLDIPNSRLNLSVSIGVVMVDGTLDSQKLLAHADTALYSAKADGRNLVRFIRPGEDEVSKNFETSRMIGLIKNALIENNFVLYFQPVYCTNEWEVLYHEALVRLKGEDKELILPGRFIPVAERYGLMPQIDRWVVKSSLNELRKYPDINLFINLSGISLGEESMLEFVEQSISESGISPSRLGFEITETAAVKDFTRVERWIRKLRSLGCRFALDDFGIGFSTFSYLRFLPVDYLKIDGSFVRELNSEPSNRAMIQVINALAHKLGKKTIAEFVEDEAALHVLRELNVDFVQGYYPGRPSPVPFDKKGIQVLSS